MANHRMFSKSITNSSRFLMMPQSAQSLYFHLGMNADDDGFCEHFTIMRMTESKPDDLKILQVKGFIHIFDDRVLVIMDWHDNNYIPKDRYTRSQYLEIYKEEVKLLSEGKYNDNGCIHSVYKQDTQVRLSKVKLSKDDMGAFSKENAICVKEKSNNALLVDYYFELKGWANKPKEYYIKNNISYSRNLKVANELLVLTDGKLKEAEQVVKKIADWANNNNLEWSFETCLKKFLEIDKL